MSARSLSEMKGSVVGELIGVKVQYQLITGKQQRKTNKTAENYSPRGLRLKLGEFLRFVCVSIEKNSAIPRFYHKPSEALGLF